MTGQHAEVVHLSSVPQWMDRWWEWASADVWVSLATARVYRLVSCVHDVITGRVVVHVDEVKAVGPSAPGVMSLQQVVSTLVRLEDARAIDPATWGVAGKED